MMANFNLSQMIADEMQRMFEETPDPFLNDLWADGAGLTYRERLDKQPRNHYGKLIPRIVTVRRNIARAKGYKPTW